MPSSSPVVSASHPAATSLLLHLVDDAAVFPPGSAPLPRALAEHRRHRTSSYAAAIGPLLVPGQAADELVDLVGRDTVAVGLIARPGTDPALIERAAAHLLAARHVRVTGVEMAWTPGWRSIDVGGMPLTLEVPRGAAQVEALDDLVRGTVPERGHRTPQLQAKFRTGATPQWEWPHEGELAAFLAGAVRRGLRVKLTGGLHHVVRADRADGPQHGLLNVLIAITVAQRDPTRTDEIEAVLAERDPLAIVPVVAGWKPAAAQRIRQTLVSYGCCGVTDPLRELADLGLLPHDLADDLPRTER